VNSPGLSSYWPTQNPLEMEGTYPLPEAQMDRFLFKLLVKFPAENELARIIELTTGSQLPESGGWRGRNHSGYVAPGPGGSGSGAGNESGGTGGSGHPSGQ